MADRSSRVISFAGSSVRVDCLDRRASRLVDFLFGSLPSSEGPAPHMTLQVRAEPAGGELSLHCADRLLYQGDSLGSLGSALLGQTTYHLSDRSHGGLLLHAAAVSVGNRCVLLPGTSGAGKTTLTAWLLKRGFDYLTDELAYVPFGSEDIQSFARPLSIKATARRTLGPHVVDFERLAPQILSDSEVTLVLASSMGAAVTPAPPRLGIIVFPRYEAGGTFSVKPVSKAEAGTQLMASLVNARNLPEHGFGEVARIARVAAACTLRYGAFSQIEEWVELLRDCDFAAIPPAPAV